MKSILVSFGILLLLSMPVLADDAPAPPPGVFDAPSHSERQALDDKNYPPDPKNPEMKRELACFYYHHFLVKQIEIGEEGATRLSIVPRSSDKDQLPCQTSILTHEFIIPGDSWSGYFKGMKANYAFFDAEDGTNGGMGFAVFDAAKKKKIFEDIAVGDIQSIEPAKGGLKLRYQRAYPASCSMPAQGQGCWDKIVRETGLVGIPMPDCAAAYLQAKIDMAHLQCEYSDSKDTKACFEERLKDLDEQKWNQDPTVVSYNVEAMIGTPAPGLIPQSGKLFCWPAD